MDLSKDYLVVTNLKKKDIRAIGKAIGVLLLYCLAIWVFLILGALLLGYVFGVDV